MEWGAARSRRAGCGVRRDVGASHHQSDFEDKGCTRRGGGCSPRAGIGARGGGGGEGELEEKKSWETCEVWGKRA